MIVRTLKLKLTSKQEAILNEWLWILTGVWNWAIKKIEADGHDGVWYSEMEFQNLLAGHSIKLGVPSHVLQGVLTQAHQTWHRCFKKQAKHPHLKGQRNKLNSIPFPDPIKPPKENRIGVLGLGKVKYYKQKLPEAKIKCGRVIKRASGWYLCLWLDCDHKFDVEDTEVAVGIDPGFSTLLTLSTGEKVANPHELRHGAERLAQAQRGCHKQLIARLQERQANRRSDRNHKISRKLVENFKTIYYSNDHFQGMARQFGKSTAQAGLGQLIGMLAYKCRTGGRALVPVNSQFTTMTCSACGARNGPTGLGGLAVRHWTCACGAHHDRDINAAINVLNAGLGMSHEGEPRLRDSRLESAPVAEVQNKPY